MQYILLNLLFFIVGIFVYVIFLHGRKVEIKNRNIFIGIFAIVAMFLCKLFPIPFFFYEIFHFKYIAFLLGGIYGGRNVAYFLFCGLIGMNVAVGGEQLYSNLVISVFMLLALNLFIRPNYETMSKLKKMSTLIIILFVFNMMNVVLNWDSFPYLRENLELFLLFILIQSFSLGLLVFISEYIKEATIIEIEYLEAQKFRVVSELAASVSHEVKNPLTVTRGFIQLLYEPTLDETKKSEYLQFSLLELNRAEEIISAYLSLAKSSEKEKVEILTVKDEIDYVIKVMYPFALVQGVEIISETTSDCFIKGNQKEFRQCLINLVKNSIEAIKDGGKILMTSILTESEVAICITDTGIGMSEEQILKLGSAFHTTKATGTGLGFLVVSQIVTKMGGKIFIDSKEGIGTTFRLHFKR